jgi:hypothetical protein
VTLMFSSDSRYAGAGTYQVTLGDGSVATATRIPAPVSRAPIGWHRRGPDERLDVIAYRYLKNATWFWQLCETNGSISPDALAAHDLIAIPRAGG